MRRLISDQ